MRIYFLDEFRNYGYNEEQSFLYKLLTGLGNWVYEPETDVIDAKLFSQVSGKW